MVNLECALTDEPSPIVKIGPAIGAPTATAKVMQAIGVNYCCLSNNHFFDHGIAGVKSSLAALKAAGITTTGFGESNREAYTLVLANAFKEDSSEHQNQVFAHYLDEVI